MFFVFHNNQQTMKKIFCNMRKSMMVIGFSTIISISCSEDTTDNEVQISHENSLANTTWFLSASVSGDEDGYMHFTENTMAFYDEDFEDGDGCWGQHGPSSYTISEDGNISVEDQIIQYKLTNNNNTLELTLAPQPTTVMVKSTIDITTLKVCSVESSLF